MSKSKILLEIGGKGYLESKLVGVEVANFALDMDKFINIRKGACEGMDIAVQMDILMSEVDGISLALGGGESAQVVREECIAAAARLLQIASSVQRWEDDLDGNANTPEVE
ncbi:hypothetical protein QE450_000821 [Paenibacillus sp. SORGH_AS306]|uniref:hypothetical protein n=1 Tax=unclassified Paenibacillus TaxID=185978 RepID=UPI002786E226|nr:MULTISPECIES: hypothetical protein [unclassified Paenibacillus]MDQ1233323.1 hypothetical protein [Paenibacillus sp. SORGH_AS_0306]MDR6110364.1 hypothetical protein [Paenibacillus sp. SORGH_AS_0338]